LHADHDSNETHSQKAAKRVNAILDGFSRLTGEVAADRTRAKERLARLEDHFGEVIVAMQFQDIVRQKLQAAAQSLARILELPSAAGDLTPLQTDVGTVSTDRQHLLVRIVAVLQDQQVVAASMELQQAETTIVRASSEMISCATEGLRGAAKLREVVAKTLVQTHAVDAFHDSLTEMQQVALASAQVMTEVSSVVDRVRTELISQMNDSVRFALQLRLVALNAQLSAARSDSAAALEELSSQTERISVVMRNAISAMLSEVRGALPQLARIDERLKEIRALSNREADTLTGEATVARDQLATLTSATDERLKKFEADFRNMHRQLRSLVDQARFGGDIDAVIDQVRETFCALIGDEGDPIANVTPDPWIDQELANLRLRYTSAEQRSVHDAIAQNLGSIAPAGDDSDTLGDQSDNVELF
jgi:hypothetical protein